MNRILLRVVLLLTSPLLAQSPLQQAVQLARDHQYVEADQALRNVPEPVAIDRRIAFYRLKAAVASGLKQNDVAVREIRQALSLAPQAPDLLLAAAVAESQAGRLDEALRHARAGGQTPGAQALIGDIEDKRGRYPEAVRAYRTAIVLAPNRKQYRVALAFELIRHQALRPAIELLTQSALLFPKSGKILTLLGIAQYADGYAPDAIKSLSDSIAADEKFEPAYGCLVQIVLESSSAPQEKVIRSLCGWDRTVCSALQLRAAHTAGDAAGQTQAIADLKLAPPENVVARCELGRAYEWSGNLQAARHELESCVRLAPTPQNHYRLGIVYQKLGLGALAHSEMGKRNETLRKMSEKTALGLNALQSFGSVSQ